MGTMKKTMKKKASKIARGKLAKAVVFRGFREKTTGGLKRDNLFKNKRGRIVSKKASSLRKRLYIGSKLEAWCKATAAAKKALGITGFVAINGKTAQGKALYAKAKSLYNP